MGSCVGPAVMSTVSPAQVLCDTEALQRGSDDLLGLREPARANHAAGEISAARLDDGYTATAQDFQIRLRGRMLPHVDVHGGRDAPPEPWSRGKAC